MLIIRMSILFSALTLASCYVSLPDKAQTKHLHALPNIDHSVTKKINKNSFFKQSSWPDKEWWHEFASVELDALMKEALLNNPSIQSVQSRIEALKQETIVVGSVLSPLVYFNGQEALLHNSQHGLYRAFNPKFPLSSYLVDIGLSFNYEFDFWGQNHNLLYESIGKERTQEAETAEVILITTTTLAQSYFAYQTNIVRQSLYEALVLVRKKELQLSQLLQQKGLYSALPPYLAEERASDAEKLLASIKEEIEVDQHLINVLAGRNPSSPLKRAKMSLKSLKYLNIPSTISVDLLARRPDLMAQIWRAKALAYKTGANMSDFYPNVNIVSLIGLQSTAWKRLLEASSRSTMVKPAINLPIFTAGAIRANIRASKAEFDAAIAVYNNLLLQSTQDVLDRLAFAESIYKQKLAQVDILKFARKRAALTQLRSQKGLDSEFDNYALEVEVIQSRLTNIMLLYQQYVASIKLIKALGGGYHEPQVPLAIGKQG